MSRNVSRLQRQPGGTKKVCNTDLFPACSDRRNSVFIRAVHEPDKEIIMGRGLLLWLIGIPLPIILLLWAFGFLS